MFCEQCGKEHDGNYGSGRFCSRECARSFSGSHRSKDSLKKTSISVSKEHLHICPKCHIKFTHKGTGPNILCLDCKLKHDRQFQKCEIEDNKIVYFCKYCGAVKGQCKRPDVCKHHQLFRKMIDLFHMDLNSLGSEEIYSEYDRISQEIYDLYWTQKFSIEQIRELVGYKSTAGSFSKFLSKFITFRNVSESTSNAFQTGRMKIVPSNSLKFKTGFHTTWNNKRYFFRSSYEEDFCKELDELKIDYEIETLKIKYFDTQLNKFRMAFPDFFIPSQNLIVEVKSLYTLNKQNMMDRFKSFKNFGYHVELLLEHKHYPDMTYFN